METEQRLTREKMAEIREKVTSNGLFLNRVPRKTKEQFTKWAEEEFDSDWGFALKWLIDFKEGMIGSQTEVLLQKVTQLEQEVEQLKHKLDAGSVQQPEEKRKEIRSLNGTVIRGE